VLTVEPAGEATKKPVQAIAVRAGFQDDRVILGPGMGPIGDTRVLLTLVEGAAVYEDPSLERR
jgi:hypothetical protein